MKDRALTRDEAETAFERFKEAVAKIAVIPKLSIKERKARRPKKDSQG
jgi:hypothetical protein